MYLNVYILALTYMYVVTIKVVNTCLAADKSVAILNYIESGIPNMDSTLCKLRKLAIFY